MDHREIRTRNGRENSHDQAGNALIMLLPFVLFLLIFGYALISRSTAEHTQTFRLHRQNVALFLAEGVLNVAMEFVNTNMDKKFRDDLIEGNLKMVNLCDKYSEIQKNAHFLTAEMPGAKLARLTMDFVDVLKFERYDSTPGLRDPKEKAGTLVFTCQIDYLDVSTTLVITRDVKVVSVVPPAAEFTLYTNFPPKDPYEINDGAIITCFNKDKKSGNIGSIRLAGTNIAHIGDRYGSANPAESPLPYIPKFLVPPVPSPVDLMLPPNAYGGIRRKSGTSASGNVSGSELARGKLRLFGNFKLVGSEIQLPKDLYGDVKKLYGVFPITHTTIPNMAPPPDFLHQYSVSSKPNNPPTIEPYAPAAGFPLPKPDNPAFGTPGHNAADYKMRSFYFAENMNYVDFKKFEDDGVVKLNGVVFANHVKIGSESEDFVYKGRGVIFADNTLNILNDVKIDKNSKDVSNLCLALSPKLGVASQIGYYKQSGKLEMAANIFSYNSLKYLGKGGCLTYLMVNGNFAVDKLNIKDFGAHLVIHYAKRINEKKNEQYVVNMSPIYSSWYEDKKGKK